MTDIYGKLQPKMGEKNKYPKYCPPQHTKIPILSNKSLHVDLTSVYSSLRFLF
jgi:hypothetical protein